MLLLYSSCKAVLESQKLVTLVPEAITSFTAELDAAAVTAAAAKSGTMFPIKFDNQEAEVGRVSFSATLALGCYCTLSTKMPYCMPAPVAGGVSPCPCSDP